jgi:predicted permease
VKGLRAWAKRLGGSWASARRERELAEEIESHLQMHVADGMREGLSAEESRRQAVLKLGGVEATKEACRDRAGLPLLEHSLQDLRFAARQLAKRPGFAVTAVFVLGLGTGAGAAIFALVDAALIRPLPYRDPARLVSVAESHGMTASRTPLSYADYLDWRSQNRVLDSLEAFKGEGYTLATSEGAELVAGTRVTVGFFRTLGVAPTLGRDFHPGEEAPESPQTVLLSHGTWQRRFGGSADVIGRTVTLSGVPHTIVGVLPAELQFAPRGRGELWTAQRGDGPCERRRSCHNLRGLGRLKDGVAIAAADAEMKAIAKRLEGLYPDSNRGQGASVVALSEELVGDVRPILLLLLGGAALLLVIATVNVASLLLVRSQGRRLEIAVRRALGASRGRLVRQFLAEGLVLVAAGSAIGLALAGGALPFLVKLVPVEMAARMPYLAGLGVNAHVLSFVAAVSVLAAILFSLTPVFRSPLTDVREGLSEGGRTSAGTVWRRFASRLVVVELATAVVLLVGAGLLGRSLERLLRVDLGFEPDHLATVRVAVPETRHAGPHETVALAREILSRMEGLPGVESVALASLLPVTYNGNTDWIRFVGRPYSGEHNEVNLRAVSAAYLTTLRAKLVSGRFFTDAEDAEKPRVVVINRALARQYFPDEDPIGKRIGDTTLSPGSIKEIIGVVADIREGALDEDIPPAVYYPFNQSPDSWFSLAVRTSQAPGAALGSIRAEIRRIDPNLGMIYEATMTDRIDDSTAAYLHRSSASLFGGFAALALILGIVGLYGVVSYSVSQRSRELGLRMALGAGRGAVYRLVMKDAGRLVAIGLAVGLAGALGATRLWRQLLFETSAFDLPTLAAVVAAVGLAALLASYVPARRAASVDPTIALRSE